MTLTKDFQFMALEAKLVTTPTTKHLIASPLMEISISRK
jgi:hypothetical protein